MKKKWIPLFVLLFIFFLLVSTPARVVVGLLPSDSGVQMYGVSDSIWSGSASRIEMNRQAIGNVDWSINPLLFFAGKLGGGLVVDDAEIKIDGSWNIAFDETITLSDMTIVIPSSRISQFIPMQGVALDGNIRIDLESLEFNQEIGPTDVSAVINWLRGSASFANNSVKLGNFTVDAQSLENGQIELNIKPTKNVLNAQGKAVVDWPRTIKLDISVTEEVPAQLKGAIAFLKKGDDNRRQLNMSLPISLR